MAQSKQWSCDINRTLNIQLGSEGYAAATPITVGQLFRNIRDKFPDNVALSWKDDGSWRKMSYKEYYSQCVRAAKSFLKLGLEPMHAVAIIGFNSPEWLIADIGAIFAGGVPSGMYATNSPDVCRYIADDSKANVVVVEDQRQLDKILKIRNELPHLKAIVQYKGKLSEKISNVYDWEEFMKLGDGTDDKVVEDIISAQKSEDYCTLIYTSGTTGDPKGVMCTHDNCTWTSGCVMDVIPECKIGEESLVSYLPLSHIAAQILDIYIVMHLAATVYFAQPDALKGTLVVTLREAQPTLFMAVPRVWEKFKDVLQKSLPPNQVIMSLPEEKQKEIQTKARAGLGLSRCKLAITAAAPIHLNVLEFFHLLKLPLCEVWGMSEGTGPVTTTEVVSGNGMRLGSIGKPYKGMEVKIDDPDSSGEGEICYRGRQRMSGYLNKREKTMEAIDDEGWLHSGDLGKVDKDGFFFITGRIKELIITSGGENIAPVPIEDRIKKEVPFLSNVMVVGDHRNYLTCLVTLKCVMDPLTGRPADDLDPEAITLISALGSSATKVSEIVNSQDPLVSEAIQTGLENANKGAISNAQKVQKWKILKEDFSVPGGELGPTLKLKRFFVFRKYSDVIDSIYS